MSMSRYEQETIINFNAGGRTATVYTRDRAIMRRFDALVAEHPDLYRVISCTDTDKTYEMPKSYISYRKPRKLSEEQREAGRERIKLINRKLKMQRKQTIMRT